MTDCPSVCCSCYNGDVHEVNIGDVVEYNLACRSKKVSAEGVTKAATDKLSVVSSSSVWSLVQLVCMVTGTAHILYGHWYQ